MLRLSTFAVDVRSVVLAGLSTTTSAAITAADSVLVALGKLQAQLTTGAFTTLSASSTVSGAGFVALHAAPGPLGNTTPGTGTFTALTNTGARIDASAYTVAPVAAATVTIPAGAGRCIINPAASLTTLTVVSPAAPANVAGSVQGLDILFTQAVTSTLTWTAGSGTTFGGAAMPTTVAAGACVRLLWVQSLAKWLHSTQA